MTTPDILKDMIVIDGLQAQNPGWARNYLEDMRAGSVTAVNATLSIWENARDTQRLIAQWYERLRTNSDILRPGLSTADIKAAKAENKTAIMMGFQNTSPLEDDIGMIEVFWRLGIRIIQLTYNAQNSVACGCWEDVDSGVSKHIGRTFIKEMNRFGILIDTSHSTDNTVLNAIECSEQPIAITHGNPKSFVGVGVELPRRNRSDHVLKALGQSGGIIGLSVYPKIAPDGARCTPERWAEMVEYTVDLIGIDHVGFGSDFCTATSREYLTWCRTGYWSRKPAVELSYTTYPEWINSSARIPALAHALADRGFRNEDIAKVMGGNFMRVLAATIDKPQQQPDGR